MVQCNHAYIRYVYMYIYTQTYTNWQSKPDNWPNIADDGGILVKEGRHIGH